MCGNVYSGYDDDIKDFITNIARIGVSRFLVDIFINNPSGHISPGMVVQRLTYCMDNFGTVYNHPRSKNPHSAKYMDIIILQMITSNIIKLVFDKE